MPWQLVLLNTFKVYESKTLLTGCCYTMNTLQQLETPLKAKEGVIHGQNKHSIKRGGKTTGTTRAIWSTRSEQTKDHNIVSVSHSIVNNCTCYQVLNKSNCLIIYRPLFIQFVHQTIYKSNIQVNKPKKIVHLFKRHFGSICFTVRCHGSNYLKFVQKCLNDARFHQSQLRLVGLNSLKVVRNRASIFHVIINRHRKVSLLIVLPDQYALLLKEAQLPYLVCLQGLRSNCIAQSGLFFAAAYF